MHWVIFQTHLVNFSKSSWPDKRRKNSSAPAESPLPHRLQPAWCICNQRKLTSRSYCKPLLPQHNYLEPTYHSLMCNPEVWRHNSCRPLLTNEEQSSWIRTTFFFSLCGSSGVHFTRLLSSSNIVSFLSFPLLVLLWVQYTNEQLP
jgi:hypothetical protein